MVDTFFDKIERINDYGSVKIQLASPNDIRSWSFGEVKKPETINYRTYRPEKDGLFCERIFGPERDYECACGKYKGTKFKGIICDRCGVKVTHSRVRRKRMGHINLAAPIVHIWFFKATPSRLGNLMAMKTSDLEKIIYFQDYVVIDPGSTPLKEKQLLTEDEYRQAIDKYGNTFNALMGAEAAKELLQRMDLDALAAELRTDLDATRSKQKIKDLSKRLKIVDQIRGSENRPEWMVMDVVPVIPPDLRPLVLLESGNFATSDLNDLYRRIINRNNRLKKLMDLNAPEVIIRNEKRMLQQAVDALFDNGRCRRPVLGSSNRPLKSLTDMIKGKQGRFRENLLGKRVDYSARSVIVVGPELKLNQCGLPKKIALELFQPFIIRKLKDHGLADTIKSAKRMLERRDPEVWDILEEVIYQHPVLLNRAPTLHRMGIQAFEPVLVEGNAIKIHPLVCGGFNADFDGDQMAVHLPLSIEAQTEAHTLILSTNNIFSPANGSPIISPSQDIVLGTYYITAAQPGVNFNELEAKNLPAFRDPMEALLAYEIGKLKIHEPIVVRFPKGRFTEVVEEQRSNPNPFPANNRIITTPGRLLFNDVTPEGVPYYNCALGKKGCSRAIDDVYAYCGKPATINFLDDMKAIGFKRSTLAGLSFGVSDLRIPSKKQELIDATQKRVDRVEKAYHAGALTERERYNQLLDLWAHCREQVVKELVKELKHDRRDDQGEIVPIDGEPLELAQKALDRLPLPPGFPDTKALDECRKKHLTELAKVTDQQEFAKVAQKQKTEVLNAVKAALKESGKWSAKAANEFRSSYFTPSVISKGFELAWYVVDSNDDVTIKQLEQSLIAEYPDAEWDREAPRLNVEKGKRGSTSTTLEDCRAYVRAATWQRITDVESVPGLDSLRGKGGIYLLRPVGGELNQGYVGKAQATSNGNDLKRRILEHLTTGDWSSAGGLDNTFMESIVTDWEMRARERSILNRGKPYLNPVYLMSDSGARGNISQMQQLAGMRGLMSKPSGEIIETPIKANFREGLNVLEYFSSTHGARKGLADTALKTADSGYLTRKLADVAQNVIVTTRDCETSAGVPKRAIYKGEEVDVPLREQIVGRIARETIINPITDQTIVSESEIITEEAARGIENLGIDSVVVRSPLTCEAPLGVCAKCYGRDLSTGRLVEEGLAVGIIAAQSIGEPGTQLTMRTFHTGGVATRQLVENSIKTAHGGVIELRDCNEVPTEDEDGNPILTSLKRNGEIAVLDDKGRELEKFKIQYGADILVKPGDKVRKGQLLARWDPHRTPILAEKPGVVRFEDIQLGETVRTEKDSSTAGKGKQDDSAGEALIVIEHKGEKHPRIVIEDGEGKILDFHYLPAKARIEVQESQQITAGHMLARQPREVAGSADIVGGLPRVTEIFEARKPKDPAVLAEISGNVELRNDRRRGKMTIIVRGDSGLEKEHHVPQDRHLLVHTGDFVAAGDPLIDGPLIPHDILRIKGEEALFTYLLEEVQNVYRAQGQTIDDKHMEVILGQMLHKVRVENPGDTNLLPFDVVDKFVFRAENQRMADSAKISEPGDTGLPVGAIVSKAEIKEANAKAEANGKTPAKAKRPRPSSARTLLLGITKASLQSESFLSGASFQETTKVLTAAALAGKRDDLIGLKENVLLGHLIPAGTGFKPYQELNLVKLAEPVAEERPSDEQLIAEATRAAEALGADRTDLEAEPLTELEIETLSAGESPIKPGSADTADTEESAQQ